MPSLGFSEALSALENPLRFATRSDGSNLHRIRNLSATLNNAIARALGAAPADDTRAALERIRELIPSDDEERGARLERLNRCLALLGELRSRVDVDATAPGATSANAPGSGSDPGASHTAPAARPGSDGPAPWPPADLPPDPGVELDTSVQWIKGVGPRLAELLAQRGIVTVRDLLLNLPRRYEDRSAPKSLAELPVGHGAVVEAEVIASGSKFIRGRRRLEVVLGDASGHVRLIWFRVPRGRFAERFAVGKRFRAAGTVSDFRGQRQIVHPEVAEADSDSVGRVASDGIVPVYSEIEGIRPTLMRTVVERVLGACRRLPEIIPAALLKRHSLASRGESVAALHRPPKQAPIAALLDGDTPWRIRLVYEELLLLQLLVLRRRARVAAERGYALNLEASLHRVADALFPFELTAAQQRVLGELEADLSEPTPMHRLVQGDVGSGKTAVALAAAAAAAQSGVQCALIAPTEILAEQHARNALKILPQAGVRVALLTGSLGAGEKRRTLAGLANGTVDLVVGTHAVIQSSVSFHRLALGIVDEQHRFGVMQRARLVEQGREGLGASPHMLVMTATPIPRTLALTVYGDLDVSVIDELPPGRTPIETHLFRDTQRQQVYRQVRQAVEAGRQAYVVFPLVEESDKEGMESLRDATGAAEELAAGILEGLRLGLLHGRMSADEKDRTMRAFAEHRLDVLVATTVVEVGVDVANATVMVIENAERFGLSQLHQLRGRVGRGQHASQCYLLTRGSSSDDAWRRLNVMVRTHDGFRIAEEDLEIRGPGDFIGTRQSGLPLLSFADLARDHATLERARQDAREILHRDPHLKLPEHAGLRDELEAGWSDRVELLRIG